MTPTPARASATPTATAVGAETNDTAGDQAAEGDAADGDTAVDWQAFVPTDTADHLATMDRAARESGCGVPWQLLAAIARVESDFGRNMATSSAGAIGYGQFLPSSWRAFGNDGNVYDYRAALPAIATYLCHSGLASDPRAALFAYNHADWYVDLVLNLAVRYDRMAPGAPTPDVLDVSPALDVGLPLHYAPGRDLRLQAQARSSEGQVRWLGVPWRGRPPRSPNSAATLETTTVAMLRAAFGLTGEAPPFAESPQASTQTLAGRAWAGGLFANPRPLGETWSVAEIRQRIDGGQSVVAELDAHVLPGHDPSDADTSDDQPVLVIGVTPDGLVYSDPSFSSSLGYGLELSDADFGAAWQAAALPLQALAISTRPEPPLRDDYFRTRPSRHPVVVADAMPTRLVADASAGAGGRSIASATQRGVSPAEPTPSAMEITAVGPIDLSSPGEDPSPPTAEAESLLSSIVVSDDAGQRSPMISQPDEGGHPSWLILAGAAAVLGGILAVRRWRARLP